jgi:hypothetical protein
LQRKILPSGRDNKIAHLQHGDRHLSQDVHVEHGCILQHVKQSNPLTTLRYVIDSFLMLWSAPGVTLIRNDVLEAGVVASGHGNPPLPAMSTYSMTVCLL